MPLILIVDDDVQIQKLLIKILEKEDYETIVASNGVEALKIYEAHRPSLSIIDIVMPEKEGVETILEMKRIDSKVRFMAISGGGKVDAKSYLEMANTLGAIATFEKPIEIDELVNEVKKVFSKN